MFCFPERISLWTFTQSSDLSRCKTYRPRIYPFLEKYLWNILKYENRKTGDMKTLSAFCRSFRGVKITVILALSRSTADTQAERTGLELRIDFRQSATANHLNALFTEAVLAGIVEGSVYEALDTVFPFPAAIVKNVLALLKLWIPNKSLQTIPMWSTFSTAGLRVLDGQMRCLI